MVPIRSAWLAIFSPQTVSRLPRSVGESFPHAPVKAACALLTAKSTSAADESAKLPQCDPEVGLVDGTSRR